MQIGRLRVDGFLLALVAATVVAALAPGLGASGGPLRMDLVTGAGIALVFFLHGATLPLESLARGARNWRLHALVQGATWVLFPLLGLAAFAATRGWLPAGLAVGLYFLCAVSSTISSSVALTAVAGGNVPGAVFNATLSGIVGVFATPLLVGLVAATAGLELSVADAIGAVATKVLLPLAAGQACRPLLAGLLGRHRTATALADRGSIVLIVYAAICDSVLAGAWRAVAWPDLLAVVALVVLLLAFATYAVDALARRAGFGAADRIAATFCGSQKSLANGLPIARVLFGGSPELGLVVLPIIVYHQLQILAGSVLAQRYAATGVARA